MLVKYNLLKQVYPGVDLVGAAFQSRLSHNELSKLEKSLFPDVANGPADVIKAFLEIRNKIVRLFILRFLKSYY